MNIRDPEVKKKFNSLHATYRSYNDDETFEHPVSGAVVGHELHGWQPEYFLEWYDGETASGYQDPERRLAHLVSMAKGVRHGLAAS